MYGDCVTQEQNMHPIAGDVDMPMLTSPDEATCLDATVVEGADLACSAAGIQIIRSSQFCTSRLQH
jgi:hypothetical protein